MNSSENWYVYYAAPAVAASALPLLRQMQEQLVKDCGIRARLEERVEAGTTPTWMEVYEGVTDPQTFASHLQAAFGASGLADRHAGARRIERFRRL
jgi:hypothetical protein